MLVVLVMAAVADIDLKVLPEDRENFIVPKLLTDGSSGYTFYAQSEVRIPCSGASRATVSLGCRLSFSEKYYARLVACSGATLRYSLSVEHGIIDSDFRGVPIIIFYNGGDIDVVISKGEELCRLVFVSRGGMLPPEINVVDALEQMPVVNKRRLDDGRRGFSTLYVKTDEVKFKAELVVDTMGGPDSASSCSDDENVQIDVLSTLEEEDTQEKAASTSFLGVRADVLRTFDDVKANLYQGGTITAEECAELDRYVDRSKDEIVAEVETQRHFKEHLSADAFLALEVLKACFFKHLTLNGEKATDFSFDENLPRWVGVRLVSNLECLVDTVIRYRGISNGPSLDSTVRLVSMCEAFCRPVGWPFNAYSKRGENPQVTHVPTVVLRAFFLRKPTNSERAEYRNLVERVAIMSSEQLARVRDEIEKYLISRDLQTEDSTYKKLHCWLAWAYNFRQGLSSKVNFVQRYAGSHASDGFTAILSGLEAKLNKLAILSQVIVDDAYRSLTHRLKQYPADFNDQDLLPVVASLGRLTVIEREAVLTLAQNAINWLADRVMVDELLVLYFFMHPSCTPWGTIQRKVSVLSGIEHFFGYIAQIMVQAYGSDSSGIPGWSFQSSRCAGYWALRARAQKFVPNLMDLTEQQILAVVEKASKFDRIDLIDLMRRQLDHESLSEGQDLMLRELGPTWWLASPAKDVAPFNSIELKLLHEAATDWLQIESLKYDGMIVDWMGVNIRDGYERIGSFWKSLVDKTRSAAPGQIKKDVEELVKWTEFVLEKLVEYQQAVDVTADSYFQNMSGIGVAEQDPLASYRDHGHLSMNAFYDALVRWNLKGKASVPLVINSVEDAERIDAFWRPWLSIKGCKMQMLTKVNDILDSSPVIYSGAPTFVGLLFDLSLVSLDNIRDAMETALTKRNLAVDSDLSYKMRLVKRLVMRHVFASNVLCSESVYSDEEVQRRAFIVLSCISKMSSDAKVLPSERNWLALKMHEQPVMKLCALETVKTWCLGGVDASEGWCRGRMAWILSKPAANLDYVPLLDRAAKAGISESKMALMKAVLTNLDAGEFSWVLLARFIYTIEVDQLLQYKDWQGTILAQFWNQVVPETWTPWEDASNNVRLVVSDQILDFLTMDEMLAFARSKSEGAAFSRGRILPRPLQNDRSVKVRECLQNVRCAFTTCKMRPYRMAALMFDFGFLTVSDLEDILLGEQRLLTMERFYVKLLALTTSPEGAEFVIHLIWLSDLPARIQTQFMFNGLEPNPEYKIPFSSNQVFTINSSVIMRGQLTFVIENFVFPFDIASWSQHPRTGNALFDERFMKSGILGKPNSFKWCYFAVVVNQNRHQAAEIITLVRDTAVAVHAGDGNKPLMIVNTLVDLKQPRFDTRALQGQTGPLRYQSYVLTVQSLDSIRWISRFCKSSMSDRAIMLVFACRPIEVIPHVYQFCCESKKAKIKHSAAESLSDDLIAEMTLQTVVRHMADIDSMFDVFIDNDDLICEMAQLGLISVELFLELADACLRVHREAKFLEKNTWEENTSPRDFALFFSLAQKHAANKIVLWLLNKFPFLKTTFQHHPALFFEAAQVLPNRGDLSPITDLYWLYNATDCRTDFFCQNFAEYMSRCSIEIPVALIEALKHAKTRLSAFGLLVKFWLDSPVRQAFFDFYTALYTNRDGAAAGSTGADDDDATCSMEEAS